MKAMIFAAGLGTRLMPLTQDRPKALVEINGKTLLEMAITSLVNFGCRSIIINVHHYHDQIIRFLKHKDNFGIEIQISDETEKLLDTGGGIKKASWFFMGNRPFLVHNVDIIGGPDLRRFYNFHISSESIATLAVSGRSSSRYFLFDDQKNLCGWRNVKTGEEKITRTPVGELNEKAFSGIHAADPGIFKYFPKEDTFPLVNFLLDVAVEKRISYFEHPDTEWFDIGTPEKLKQAEIRLRNKN